MSLVVAITRQRPRSSAVRYPSLALTKLTGCEKLTPSLLDEKAMATHALGGWLTGKSASSEPRLTGLACTRKK